MVQAILLRVFVILVGNHIGNASLPALGAAILAVVDGAAMDQFEIVPRLSDPAGKVPVGPVREQELYGAIKAEEGFGRVWKNEGRQPLYLSPWNWWHKKVAKHISGDPALDSLALALTVNLAIFLGGIKRAFIPKNNLQEWVSQKSKIHRELTADHN